MREQQQLNQQYELACGCPKLTAIVPMVPIMPVMGQEIHRQWQAYGGFSWAFEPYMVVLDRVDHPDFNEAMCPKRRKTPRPFQKYPNF